MFSLRNKRIISELSSISPIIWSSDRYGLREADLKSKFCACPNHTAYVQVCTLKCLSIGTPNLINFPFVSNGKLMVFRCPNIQAHYNEAVLCLKFGTPENNEFSIWNKWKIYYF